MSQRYEYDQNGNRSQVTFGNSIYKYTLSTSSNRLVATTGPLPAKTNTYDAAGNLTGDGTISYTYGANGRMETSSAANVVTSYRYNGRGERVAKTSSTGLSYYVYDEQGHLLGEYDASGFPIQETVYLGDLPVAVIKPGVSGSSVYYVYTDHLQTPRVLTRAGDHRMVWRWDHADPFGLIQPDENPSGLGKFTYNLRFPGQVFDKETNNYYNYFRDYDPQLGRYVQSDPIGLNGGTNTYTYVDNDPVKLTDSTGQAPDQWWRPCNTSQTAECVVQCESQGKEFESCAVRWMSGKGGKRPWAGTPSNGGLSCSCKEKQLEGKAFAQITQRLVAWVAS